ncbi:hypothetical protein LTR04_005583 [Oleoguttula sp. CCFEE 6159]|nr:hypothetical protein LTR04_005583 [Oleoguttula sp. CCFEE 6159]
MSGMSSMWSSFGLSSNPAAKIEKQNAAIKEDLKYLYSAFTKIPCLSLAPDHKARLIEGYEEFPFDTAVPLFAFKNLSALEICDIDFRQFFGWDRLAEQLRSLTVKRGQVDDLTDLLVNVVLDDIDKRRRRSSKAPPSPVVSWPAPSPTQKQTEFISSAPPPDSPLADGRRGSVGSPQAATPVRGGSTGSRNAARVRQRSASPSRPSNARHGSSYSNYGRGTPGLRRSSGSSGSSLHSNTPRNSTSNLLSLGVIPASKWRFLRHLSLADNGLTSISSSSLAPIASTLQSLDLSSNLFTEIPESLASLVSLRALNLSACMIESLHSLARNPLPAITTLNLRSNRLLSLAGIQRLFSLERVDLRDNKLSDPTELARLTGIPDLQEIYVTRNPFTRTHANYRVTIFNLFRATPGYSEDIIIDSTGPSYNERRQLVDRTPEAASVPIMRPLVQEDGTPPPTAQKDELADTSARDEVVNPRRQHSSAQRTRSEYGANTQRRRKGPKRRIVELSQSESVQTRSSSTPSIPQQNLSLTDTVTVTAVDSVHRRSSDSTPTRTRSTQLASQVVDQHRLSQIDTALGTPTSDIEADPIPNQPRDLSVNGDLYRQKIEALKNDLGDSWLSALGEDKWENQQCASNFGDRNFSPTRTIRPVGGPDGRVASQAIVSGSRTLG